MDVDYDSLQTEAASRFERTVHEKSAKLLVHIVHQVLTAHVAASNLFIFFVILAPL